MRPPPVWAVVATILVIAAAQLGPIAFWPALVLALLYRRWRRRLRRTPLPLPPDPGWVDDREEDPRHWQTVHVIVAPDASTTEVTRIWQRRRDAFAHAERMQARGITCELDPIEPA